MITPSKVVRTIRHIIKPKNAFLKKVNGIIHVGANTGQERDLYAGHDLNVVWVEPIPAVFEQLCLNLSKYPKQKAYCELLTDSDGREYAFHVASNGGLSSSILPMARHKEMWPKISYTSTIRLGSTTLQTFVEKQKLNLDDYGALVLDTQGSELMILKGGESILSSFQFVQVEAPDFESYAGCCQTGPLGDFMRSLGFREDQRSAFMTVPGLGTYYDVLYLRSAVPSLG